MPLKPKNPKTHSEPPPLKDELSGPWGKVNLDPDAVIALRLCKKARHSSEESYSYPYRVISSWHWCSVAGEEELKIEASSDVITVKGRGLDRIVEALDRNALEALCESYHSAESTESQPIFISSIEIKNQSEA